MRLRSLHRDAAQGALRFAGAPRLSLDLAACAAQGHVVVGTGARRVEPADALLVREAWPTRMHRCVRCLSWVEQPIPAEPVRDLPERGDEVAIPLRGRGLRDLVIIRLIAIDKALHALVALSLAVTILIFADSHVALHDLFLRLVSAAHRNTADAAAFIHPPAHGILHDIDRLLGLGTGQLRTAGLFIGLYGLLNALECAGLWRQRRWAEYLSAVATSLFIPIEVYELAQGLSPFKLGALIVNVAVVIWLVRQKRLFGLRGGEAAVHAAMAQDRTLAAVERDAALVLAGAH